jgi:hypothetical protein
MPAYLIQPGESPFVKIGFARDPYARLRDLQAYHYEELRIVRLIEAAFRVSDGCTAALPHSGTVASGSV